jgi:1-acyl-sn-glycerol-3-phosphate acyltransferase
MDDWHYEPAPDLEQSMLDRLQRFPREPDMLTYACRSLVALIIRAWLRTYHRLEIEGIENIPRSGSFVLVANHASHLDALCLLSAIPLGNLHRAFSAAAKDYFFVSVPRVALAILVVNALPFDRELHIRHSLQLCRQLLLSNPGNMLVLFPEGTRSTDGTIAHFKPGIAMLVAGTEIPVIPCYLSGTNKALPKGAMFPRPRKIRLSIGQARTYAKYEPDKHGAAFICEDLHRAVVDLAAPGGRLTSGEHVASVY